MQDTKSRSKTSGYSQTLRRTQGQQTRIFEGMGVRLQQRDVKILEALHTARYMSTPQIASLFWRESKAGTEAPKASRMRACQRRLKQLTDEELVRRIEIPVLRGEGPKPYIYTLAKGAVYILEGELGIPGEDIEWKKKPREHNYPFLEHLLATNDFRIALTLACEEHPNVTLLEWVDERELRTEPERVDIEWERTVRGRTKTYKEKGVAVVPDGAFILEILPEEGESLVKAFRFVEIDRATVTVEPTKWHRRGWAKKIRAYDAFLDKRSIKQGGRLVTPFTARYGASTARVLTVTTSDLRLENIVATAEKTGKGRLFWFTTFDQISPDKILSCPIWREAGKEAGELKRLVR